MLIEYLLSNLLKKTPVQYCDHLNIKYLFMYKSLLLILYQIIYNITQHLVSKDIEYITIVTA